MADIAQILQAVREGLSIARDATQIGLAIADAALSGDTERVEEILPAQSRLSVARELAEAKARAKFGPKNNQSSP